VPENKAAVHPTAVVHPGARLGPGVEVGPFCAIDEHVVVGPDTVLESHVRLTGWTEIGAGNRFSPFVCIGGAPQDVGYKGEETRIVIGDRNIFREYATVHRATVKEERLTSIGSGNYFMASSHVAHDCRVGNRTIFANNATLAGHVEVQDDASISAFSAVHQFCRVGRHAFVGGYTVVTKDALPFAKTVGNRARIYGLNTVGLIRRGFSPEIVGKLKRAYRYLLQSKLNTSRALAQIEQDASLACPDVQYLVEFIRTSQRGPLLRRPTRRAEEMAADE
jgi:UDP-N-acetylglucosamine acyltransferase